MIARIDFKASEAVRAALSAIGRTEDLRFSPDNRLLVIAGYARKRLLVLRVDIEAGGPSVAVRDFMELTSGDMGEIHGLDFIDDRTLVVGNRDGHVVIFALPAEEPTGQSHEISAIRRVKGKGLCRLNSPGSLAVKAEPHGRVSLLVCNNYTHMVTRHVVNRWLGYRTTSNRRLLARGLDIPDGITLSHDGRWIAISSHGTQDVKLYRISPSLGPETEPAGVLTDAGYPHGVRFTADDRHILVADAGSRVVNVYAGDGGWSGRRAPVRSPEVIDEEAFLRGRANVEEGGPKGLDIDRSNNVVAITCEEQTLAFFSLASMIGSASASSSWPSL
ncbi:SMP-30/gluconolactonase/LRE family protein [Mesorhizobium comanense]|uniref:SMP-30/gluconolactonase/LRE family protein n=1 Tax=Mesorhizobium comanense TaxID=2502215 RepID=UPI0010F8B291|nr:lactonase family protein [Mesorhizobium comanense]